MDELLIQSGDKLIKVRQDFDSRVWITIIGEQGYGKSISLTTKEAREVAEQILKY